MDKTLTDFLLSTIATFCLAVLFHVPKKGLWPGAILGGIGYTIFKILSEYSNNQMIPYFLATFFITIGSEVFARLLKMPATVFTVPGIITIVPGLQFYKAMTLLVERNFRATAAISEAFLAVLGIAMAMVLISLFTKSINNLLNYIIKFLN